MKEADISERRAGKATDLRSMRVIPLTLSSAVVTLPHNSFVFSVNVKLVLQTSKCYYSCNNNSY